MSSTKPSARMYLVHDPGFVTTTVNSIFFIVTVLACGYAYHPVRFAAMDVYEWIKLQMLQTAHKMAWWSLLGLLSSSCCVIQILLNALSLGCSGINTILGPVRPHFMALAAVTNTISLWVAYQNPFQWPATAAGFALSVFLAFTPEMLYLVTKSRLQPANMSERARTKDSKSMLQMELKPGAMGCISCVSKVCKVVEQHEDVVSSAVDFNTAKVSVELRKEGTDADSIAASIQQSLVGSNFPVASWTIQPLLPSAADKPQTATKPASTGSWLAASWGVVEAVLAGLLGSSCCLVQLIVNLLTTLNVIHGVGCTGLNKTLGPMRFQLRALTAAYMAWSWFLAVKRGWSKQALLTRTLIFVAVTFLPEILMLSGGPALAPPAEEVEIVTFKVDGMGCEACQVHVKGVIDGFDGVVASSVDFTSGIAEVHVARSWGKGAGGSAFEVGSVASKLDEDGYFVDPADALVHPAAPARGGEL